MGCSGKASVGTYQLSKGLTEVRQQVECEAGKASREREEKQQRCKAGVSRPGHQCGGHGVSRGEDMRSDSD